MSRLFLSFPNTYPWTEFSTFPSFPLFTCIIGELLGIIDVSDVSVLVIIKANRCEAHLFQIKTDSRTHTKRYSNGYL